jgi:TRAP-type C4-dicarboxylate transport system permease small subunit
MPSKGFLRGLPSRLLAGMEKGTEWVVVAIITAMVANISAGVFSRYVFHLGIPFTEELGRYLMIWMGYLGAALAMKEGSHVGITAVVNLFRPAVRRYLHLLAHLVVFVFLALVFVRSFAHLDGLSIQRSSAMEIPMVIPYLSVIVGIVLLSIENLVLMVRAFVVTDKPGDGE